MNKRTLRVLEYNKILERLEEYAVSTGAKAKVRHMKPLRELDTIEQLQQNTRDAFLRLENHGNVSFSGIRNVAESLRLIDIGSSISAAELLDIAGLLEASSEVKNYGEISGTDEENKTFDSLTSYFDTLTRLDDISGEIRRCLLSADEIADDASPALRSIRRKIAEAETGLHQALNKIIKSESNRIYLMDTLITTRNGRYCIPVKVEYKKSFPGLVHDHSASGSTVFIEPMAVVELNNTIQELHTDEALEIEKILSDLSQSVAPVTEDITENYKILVELDFIFAKAKYAKATDATEPKWNDQGIVELKKAVHPLLDRKTAVPIDIKVGEDYNLLIITGPNTGGKTVSLKTLGLLTLMGQSGLHIPAMDGSQLTVFDDVFADIGDEQSIELSLSTFSSHMSNISYIVKHATEKSLVLFDEPGGGTDPAQGAALAISILNYLKDKGTRVMATTHYTELKTYAISEENVENASCEFDEKTLRPTYRLLIGIPGSSNAFQIAKQLGLPDEITVSAEQSMDSASVKMDQVIRSLEENEREISRLRTELEIETNSEKQLRERLAAKEKKLDEKKAEILEKAKEEARDIVDEAKTTADDAIRTYNKWLNSPGSADARSMEQLRTSLREKRDGYHTKKEKKEEAPKTGNHKASDFHIGDAVMVLSLNTEGHVQELPDSKGKVLVGMGILSSWIPIDDLQIIEEDKNQKNLKKQYTRAGNSHLGTAIHFKPEINLLGKTVDEATAELDKFLDEALITNTETVRVIHGKGTGALRKGVTDYLKKKKFVKEFRSGEFGEGDAGVTIVTLK